MAPVPDTKTHFLKTARVAQNKRPVSFIAILTLVTMGLGSSPFGHQENHREKEKGEPSGGLESIILCSFDKRED